MKQSIPAAHGLMRRSLITVGLVAAMLLPHASFAQLVDYPNKPIRFIVPFPAGTGTDLSARYFAKKLSDLVGQPVIVDNRGGANGFPAAVAVKNASADGYTIFFASNSSLATNLALFKSVPYDPLVDFAPISTTMKSPMLLVVPPNSPFKTVADYVNAAKNAPGKLNQGSGSAGYQLMGEFFSERVGIKVVNIPYKGVPETLMGVMSGQLDVAVAEISAAVELVKSGKVRVLMVGSDHRLPILPDVPTAAEAGYPGFTGFAWTGVVAPAATPKPVLDKLSALFMQILAMPETKQFYAAQNVQIMTGGADEMRPFWREQIDLWTRIAISAKVERQ